ncbi:LysR family transcriptional regulator [soil metagenome]
MNNNLLIYYALSFLSVIKAGSYSSAAKNSGISKAQLSRHVKALEELLGIQLLHRTTRTLVLTEQGKQFFIAFEGIAERCDEAINLLKHDFKGMHGTVKITAPVDWGIRYLPPITHEFSNQYPNLNIVLSFSNAYENLNENNFDIAIRIANNLPDSDLCAKTLKKFKRIICASAKFFENKKIPKHPDELKNFHCITGVLSNSENIYPQWHFRVNNKMTSYKLERNIQVDSTYAQIALIKSGTGIGRIPEFFIEDEIKSGELIELFPTLEKPVTHLYILYSGKTVLPKKTRALIEFISEKIMNHK